MLPGRSMLINKRNDHVIIICLTNPPWLPSLTWYIPKMYIPITAQRILVSVPTEMVQIKAEKLSIDQVIWKIISKLKRNRELHLLHVSWVMIRTVLLPLNHWIQSDHPQDKYIQIHALLWKVSTRWFLIALKCKLNKIL